MAEIDQKIDEIYQKVTDTFRFHGVMLTGIDLDGNCPKFYVSISKKAIKKPIDQVLNLVYWTLWVFVYGEYSIDKSSSRINLDYCVTE